VPDRVAIIGVNNDDLICDSSWPPLSSVDCDYSRVGYAAAEMLDQQLKGKKLSKDERLVRMSPLGVIQRQSTDIFAVDNPDVADAVRFIREHACDPCSVPDVLEHIPVGRRWLERQFKAKLGRNPNDEILRVRVDTATRLLLQPNLTLSNIADRCGFGSVHNFCRTYARIRGVSPAAYRRDAMRGS
jgi:LacI family transcriptional regulator